MEKWLTLTEEQRRATLDQAATIAGLPAYAIEKDWWVTLSLKALFTSVYKDQMIFKGGTSLSKCWNLIERFSEDIDIALDSTVFGIDYVEKPSDKFLRKLKKAGYNFTSTELKTMLEKYFAATIPGGIITIDAEPFKEGSSYPDPQTLYLKYKSLYEQNAYLPSVVKIEVGVRSLKEPKATVQIKSILSGSFPNEEAYPETPFELMAVEAHRTFLEKVFLLHEEFQKPDVAKIKSNRMSRHLYDLEKMMDHEVGKKALADKELYEIIIKHRATYTRIAEVDYTTHQTQAISFLPPDHIKAAYSQDYEAMKTAMIYGEALSFENLIARLMELHGRFRNSGK
jgi:predicted nucleotidyltransferase component of viral defense system